MAINGLLDLIGLVSVLVTTLTDKIGEISGTSERVNLTHLVPEEIVRMDLFPEITTIRLPVLHNPIKIVFHEWPNFVLGLIFLVVLHEDGTPLGQGVGSQSWTVVLGSTPSAGERGSGWDLELWLNSDVDVVRLLLGLDVGDPSLVSRHNLVDLCVVEIVDLHVDKGGQSTVSHPVVIVIASRGVVVRSGHNSA